ncbi:hypothetical protein DJ77_07180 [Halorubrum ezzemoulense]|nr:hypothetical protein DJ77_07180 [Halorubrum ezzemoulense]
MPNTTVGRQPGQRSPVAFEDQQVGVQRRQRPGGKRTAVESLYRRNRQMDAETGALVAARWIREELDDTLLVVTSDHGEGFGEPSRLQDGVRIAEHGVSVHDAVVHVPLLVRYPGQTTPHRIERPATLTAFPDVVNRFRDGDRPDAGFCPDEPVITTAVGLDEPLQKRASNYVEDISPWVDTKRAVFEYDEHEGVVEKYCRVGDTAATIRVRDAQTDYRVAGTDDGRVDAAFDAFERLDVRTDGEDLNDLDDETYGRLEDLGYV